MSSQTPGVNKQPKTKPKQDSKYCLSTCLGQVSLIDGQVQIIIDLTCQLGKLYFSSMVTLLSTISEYTENNNTFLTSEFPDGQVVLWCSLST